ncbi:hypothetical protein EXW94_25515 [Enterobacter sp. JMULE2]|uniref:hypothetical protein n=1 Tax=Enterobacter sp. JMULE2 TaxID=2518340 RepID=UPI0015769FD0|nr:hypothetical protein [Enterobacter sp. JMULE2]NTZ40959.1 hypothetical protein [Enterobacter sp. JMULE2]
MLPHITSNGQACIPSPTVIITKAIIQCISAGQRVFVRPVMDGQRKVVPALVVAPLGLAVNSYINTAYEPAGAIWKSPKGSRMGVFFMPDRAGQVNKVLFDYIAVINPEIFIPYFKECWATGEHDNPLTLLNTLLMSTNAAAEWIKWPDKIGNTSKWRTPASEWFACDMMATGGNTVSAAVTGIENSQLGETIFILQVTAEKSTHEFQLVRSLGSTLLLDNTGNAVPPGYRSFESIRLACINAVRSYAKYNKPVQSEDNLAIAPEVTASSN